MGGRGGPDEGDHVVGVSFFCGFCFADRLTISLTNPVLPCLRLNHPSEPTKRNASRETLIAQEERKRAFWSTFMLDRLLSVGGWSHSMTEEDTVRNFAGNAALLNAADFRDLGVVRRRALAV